MAWRLELNARTGRFEAVRPLPGGAPCSPVSGARARRALASRDREGAAAEVADLNRSTSRSTPPGGPPRSWRTGNGP